MSPRGTLAVGACAVVLVVVCCFLGPARATTTASELTLSLAEAAVVSREEWQIREQFRKVERAERVKLFAQKHRDDARLDMLWAQADAAQKKHELDYSNRRSKIRQDIEDRVKELYMWHTKGIRQEQRTSELERLFKKVALAWNRGRDFENKVLRENVTSTAGRKRMRRALNQLRNRVRAVEKDLQPLTDAITNLEVAMRGAATAEKFFRKDFRTTQKTVNDFVHAKKLMLQNADDLSTETKNLAQGQSDLDLMSATDTHEVERIHGILMRANKLFVSLTTESSLANKKGLQELTELAERSDDILQRQTDYQHEVQARVDSLAHAIPEQWTEEARQSSHQAFTEALHKLKLQFVNLKAKLTNTVNTISQQAMNDPSWTLGGLEDQIVDKVVENLAQFQKKKQEHDDKKGTSDAFNWLNPSKNTDSFVIKEAEQDGEKETKKEEKAALDATDNANEQKG